jgi:hypothetical protein
MICLLSGKRMQAMMGAQLPVIGYQDDVAATVKDRVAPDRSSI